MSTVNFKKMLPFDIQISNTKFIQCSLQLPSLIDSDEEPVLKHPRLVGPTEDIIHNLIPANAPQEYPVHSSCDDDDSFSEDDDQPQNGLVHDSFSLKDTSTGSEADTEGSMVDDDNDIIMASLRDFGDDVDDVIVPDTPVAIFKTPDKMDHDQVVIEDMNADIDFVDGIDPEADLNVSLYDDDQPAPVTVIKRPKKPSDVSKFNRSNRKSKNCATFYFKHHDTDSDRQMVSGASGTEDKSQEETSEEEWTYTACDKENSPDNTDVMTSSFEQPSEALDDNESNASKKRNGNARLKLEFGDVDESTINAGSNETISKANKISELRNDTSNSQTNNDKNSKPNLNEHNTHQTLISKESIKRLVNQAEELVQKQAQMKKIPKELAKGLPKKNSRNFMPLNFGEEVKAVQGHNKMSRIKEWLQQNDPNESQCEDSQQVLDSCDASGEYTTGDSEPDRQSVTSEELSPSVATYRNATSSQEHSINVATPTNQSTPEHTKVILRGKRSNSQTTRPWSVSCLSQLSYATKGTTGSALNTPTADGVDGSTSYGRSSGMSISESALNTLATGSPGIGENSTKDGKYVFQGSTSSVKTTVQGNISSSTTINEGCINCFENLTDSKHCATKRKRMKLRRRHQGALSNELETEELRLAQIASSKRGNRLVKSCSFSGRSSMLQKELKQERCTASDPSSSRNKSRFDSSSTSGNDSEEDLIKTSTREVCLTRSNDRTLHASTSEDQENNEESTENTAELAPKFKLGPEAGLVRPRMPINIDRERASLLGLTIVERSVLADMASADRDSDVDRSVQTAGTEEHSSFSEQAWDFYQEKYNSEPYSEAPDSDAARRLLEFGDDYRAYIDSQSDCCSSLSAHPDHEPSPHMGRRRLGRPLNYSPTDLAERNRKAAMGNPTDSPDYGSFGRRSKKSSSSNIDRKKTLMDSLERSKRSPGTESLERMKRAKKILTDSLERRNSKRSSISDCDLLNNQSQARRKHTSSNSTSSDINNSSLEYQHSTKLVASNGGNKPDIIDSVNKRSRKPSNESNKSKFSNESNAQDSPKRYHDSSLNSSNSLDSPARRKRYFNNAMDDSSDGGNNPRNKSQSLPRRRGSSGIVLLPLPGSNSVDGRGGLDSDSDVDDVQHLIERSHSQLEATEAVLAKEETTPDLLQPNDYVRKPFDSDLECSNRETNIAEADKEVSDEPKDKEEEKKVHFRARFCFAVAIFSIVIFVCLNSYK